MAAPAVATAVNGCSVPLFGSMGSRQMEVLKAVVAKHIQDPALKDIVASQDFAPTSTERGVMTWEHQHIVAALDVVNTYQRDRRARTSLHILGHRAGYRKSYRQDARTRVVELLKQWLRTQAAVSKISEQELKSVSGLCRDVLTHPKLFPPRNGRSFIQSMAEVYDHLQWQLREVLERDRTCADLAQRVLSLSKNLLSDALVYLLLAPTDLKQTDALPSLEVVTLWQSLPTDANPLPSRTDPSLQKSMKDGWRTSCGSLVAAVLSTRWCVRLFDGAGAKQEASTVGSVQAGSVRDAAGAHDGEALPRLLADVRAEFAQDRFRQSGLVGVLRRPELRAARESYLAALEAVFDLSYLLGEALVQFHRISDGLGDYGMIRVAPWLHPFLEALVDKVQFLKMSLKHLDDVLDKHLFLAKAHGRKVEMPIPSSRMGTRAHDAIGRAIKNNDNHVQNLLQALEDLRARSAPERLPNVVEGLGDACAQLAVVIASPEFRHRVGDSFPALPTLGVPVHTVELCDGRGEWTAEEQAGELDFDADSRGSRALSEPCDSHDGIAACVNRSSSPPGVDRTITAVGKDGGRVMACENAVDGNTVVRPGMDLSLNATPFDAAPTVEVTGGFNPFDEDCFETVSTEAAKVNVEKGIHHTDVVDRFAEANKGDAEELVFPPQRAAVKLRPRPLADGDRDIQQRHVPVSVVDLSRSESPESTFCGSSEDGFGARTPTSSSSSSVMLSEKNVQVSEHCALPQFRREVEDRGRLGHVAPMQAPPPLTAFSVNLPTDAVVGTRSQTAELRSEVFRLTTSRMGNGWRRHDRRSLKLWDGFLHIFEKGSTRLVKSVLLVGRDVQECSLLSSCIMSLVVRVGDTTTTPTHANDAVGSSLRSESPAKLRTLSPSKIVSVSAMMLGKRSSSRGASSRRDVGDDGTKAYFFEFSTSSEATTFHREIVRLRSHSSGGISGTV